MCITISIGNRSLKRTAVLLESLLCYEIDSYIDAKINTQPNSYRPHCKKPAYIKFGGEVGVQ